MIDRLGASGTTGGVRAWLVGAHLLAIGFLLWMELLIPPDIPLGVAVLVPVVSAALLLDRRAAVGILIAAAATRVLVAVVGDVSVGLAAVEITSFAILAALALSWRRAAPAAVPSVAASLDEPASYPAEMDLANDASLTQREHEVLQMAMFGLTAAQVAARLHISPRTVETHLERAYSKLGVHSKQELIALRFDEARGSRPQRQVSRRR